MRAVLQRVRRASVTIDNSLVGEITHGWLVLLGIAPSDTPSDGAWLAEKIVNLRAFADDAGKMNRSVQDVCGSVLVVSQFTLYGDCQKGRRPSFIGAARPDHAIPLYDAFLTNLKSFGVPVASGRFGADMQVELLNDGPVTLLIESRTGDPSLTPSNDSPTLAELP
jgi:D-aminoacyl-tRNA deacylase